MRTINQLKPDLERMAQAFGPVFKEYLELEIQRNLNIMDCKSFEEMVGRQEAVKMMRKMFSFITSLESKGEEPDKTSYR